MQCYVYRSSVKEGLYVYLAKADGLDDLPEPVRKQLGDAELALEFDLTPDRTLPNGNAAEILKHLADDGFHVQMPADIEHLLARIAQGNPSGKPSN